MSTRSGLSSVAVSKVRAERKGAAWNGSYSLMVWRSLVNPGSLPGNFVCYFMVQQVEIVAETQCLLVGKEDLAFDLFMKDEVFAPQFQLAEQAVERGVFILGRGKVGDGVEAGLKQGVVAVIIGVEATDAGVFFQDQDIWIETGETNCGGQSRETAADNQQRYVHL